MKRRRSTPDAAKQNGKRASRSAEPIVETIRRITEKIQEDAWAEIPSDLSYNHDHYLYGTPKKP